MATANLLNDWLLVVCGHAKAPQRLGLCQVDVYVAAQKVGEDQLTNLILGVDHAAHEHLLKHCGAGSLLLRVCVYACMQRFAPAPRTVAGCTHTIKGPVGLRLQDGYIRLQAGGVTVAGLWSRSGGNISYRMRSCCWRLIAPAALGCGARSAARSAAAEAGVRSVSVRLVADSWWLPRLPAATRCEGAPRAAAAPAGNRAAPPLAGRGLPPPWAGEEMQEMPSRPSEMPPRPSFAPPSAPGAARGMVVVVVKRPEEKSVSSSSSSSASASSSATCATSSEQHATAAARRTST